MHRLRPALAQLPGFLYFIFRDFRDLIRLLMGTWAMAMAIWAVRDDARYSSPDPAMSALGGAFIGCLTGLLLAYVLLLTYRFWVYLHYRVRPKVKVWFKVSLLSGGSVLCQAMSQSTSWARRVAAGIVYALVLTLLILITVGPWFSLMVRFLSSLYNLD